ncbi:uncharacterized protein LOC117883423 isoform X2 [Trachemys scripta elegans]|uniref:uncharacterized protein LOC117883423 isoform X2 n=1 Tax=Trachemys scripta elegans TaxID=31138 RepID=UPI001555248D|nr:uncharacterized protein LOC117883423 isoform X2 [Trachemys scripta elegans]
MRNCYISLHMGAKDLDRTLVSLRERFTIQHAAELWNNDVGMVSACQSTGLAPTGDRVVGAVGCTVVFPGPEHIDITGVVRWEYKQNENDPELTVVLYYVASPNPEILPEYKDRVVFNMSDWSLGLKMQLADQGLYRLRREEEEKSGKWIKLEVIVAWLISWYYVLAGPPGERMTAAAGSCIVLPGLDQLQGVSLMQWKFSEQYLVTYHVNNSSLPDIVDQDRFLFQKSNGSLQICGLKVNDSGIYTLIINMKKQNDRSIQLEVIEPVSQPELWSNLSLIGLTTELVCNTSVEKVAKYQWKKDGKPLPIESHYQLSQNNSVLLILTTTWSDKGSYSCNVSNEVSWHEISLELSIQQNRKRIWMLLPIGICMIACVVTGIFIFKSSS